MRKLIVLVGVVLLLALALTAYASPTGPSDGIDVQGSASTFSGTLQEPDITSSSSDSVTVEGANATFRDHLQEPWAPDSH